MGSGLTAPAQGSSDARTRWGDNEGKFNFSPASTICAAHYPPGSTIDGKTVLQHAIRNHCHQPMFWYWQRTDGRGWTFSSVLDPGKWSYEPNFVGAQLYGCREGLHFHKETRQCYTGTAGNPPASVR